MCDILTYFLVKINEFDGEKKVCYNKNVKLREFFFIVFLAFFIFGLIYREYKFVFNFAKIICYSCIGIE